MSRQEEPLEAWTVALVEQVIVEWAVALAEQSAWEWAAESAVGIARSAQAAGSGLGQAVCAKRNTDHRVAASAGQLYGVERKHRQDDEHAQHAQPENTRETKARAQLLGRHAV